MALPYRTRRVLRGLAIAALWLVLIAVMAWLVWLLWLDRFVVYTRDGAKFDFSLPEQVLSGEVAVPPQNNASVTIYYNEGDNALNITTELTQMSGFYIDAKMLSNSIPEILELVKKLPAQTPVMIEVKDIVGRFFYSTSLGSNNKSIDTVAMNSLIDYLIKSDLYTIAKVPAFRDYYYGLEHVSDGLPMRGGYLWMDEDRCYWLNPSSDGTMTYLIQIAKELKNKGFNEILFSDFRFPDTDKIVFSGSKTEALNTAAKKLLEACGSERFAVSFLVKDATFALPSGRTRMYLEGVGASQAKVMAEESGLEDPTVKLAFITDVNDTRFNAYSVLRPITLAQFEE